MYARFFCKMKWKERTKQDHGAPKCSKLELTPTGGQWIKSPSRLQRLRRPSSPSPALFSFSGKRFSPRHRGDLHFSGMGLSTWGHGHVRGTWARRAPHPGCSGGKPRQPRPSSQHSTRLPASSLESRTMMGGDVPRASPADGLDGRETFCRSAGIFFTGFPRAHARRPACRRRELSVAAIFFTGFPRAHARRPACRRRELSVAACRSKDGDSSIQLAFSSGKN